MAKEIEIEEITAALPIMIRTSGWFYIEAAKALTEDFGAEGERTVRRWLRRWGQWRGRELRRGHMALGLPMMPHLPPKFLTARQEKMKSAV